MDTGIHRETYLYVYRVHVWLHTWHYFLCPAVFVSVTLEAFLVLLGCIASLTLLRHKALIPKQLPNGGSASDVSVSVRVSVSESVSE